MAWTQAPRRSRNWSTRWNPEVLKEELRKGDRSLRAICRAFSTRKLGWQAFYLDARRWARSDLELGGLLNGIAVSNNPNGRPRMDMVPENADWMVPFCEEYLKEKNKSKASKVTPFKPATILKMLNPKDTSYNAKFAEMVDLCDMQLLEMAKELAWEGAAEATGSTTVSAKDKVWIGVNIAKVAKGTDWNQQKMDLNITGNIKFEAQRAKVTQELVADQRSHFERVRQPLLIESGRAEDRVIDVMPIEEKVESSE